MATNVKQVIQTLGDVFQWMKPYAGGSVPGGLTPEYSEWRLWVQLAQQDATNRTFWRRFLVPETITITKDLDYIDLPDKFSKINGLYVLDVNGVDWNENGNEDGQKIFVYMDPVTAAWKAKFIGFTPTETVTAKLWYFYNPPKPVQEVDPIFLDGEMIGFGALKEYFRKKGELGSLDDARIEYENRFDSLSALEAIPSRQELMQWSDSYSHSGIHRNERSYYSGRARFGDRSRKF
jgi:hypothetical protein